MADSLKRFRITYKSKAGGQRVTLMARNKQEAEVLANTYQTRRAGRRDITFERIDKSLKDGKLDPMLMGTSKRLAAVAEDPKQLKALLAAETERRKLDFSRYDYVSGDEVGIADAPLTIEKIEEVS